MNLKRVVQRAFIALGVVAFGIALAMMYGMGVELPFGWFAVSLGGVLSILIGLLTVRDRLRSDVTETDVPDPELPPYSPPPGDDVDQALYEMIELRHGLTENRERIEDRVERAAIRLIRKRDDCSRTEAIAQLQSGEWTDNEVAAAFFTGDEVEIEGVDGGGGITALFGADEDLVRFKKQLEITVEELSELSSVEFSPPTEEQSESTLSRIRRRIRGGEGAEETGDEGEVVATNWNAEDSSIESIETDEPFVDIGVHETNRWLGVSAFALISLGVGTFLTQPGLVVAGSVGVAYAAYARATAVPATENLEVERTLSDEDPRPGDEIQIEVTVRNRGGSTLADLRLIDVVPDPFVVTRGSPRMYTALRPGDEVTFSYEVLVERGQYRWPMLAVARDLSGSTERESLVTPEQDLVCKPALAAYTDTPVRAQTTMYSGDVETEQGGPGLEFHSVREYRKSDPMNRINWKRFARTGEFSTVDFRQEKAATITLLFDTRESAFTASRPGMKNAVNLSADAATNVFTSLYDAGNLVGIAAFDTVPCWLSPGAGSEHIERAKLLFATHPALSPIPPSKQNIEGSYIDPMTHVRRQLPNNSQVFLFTPLADDYAAETARRLDSAGHLVTIITPDTTNDETVGQRLAMLERNVRIGELRERGIRAIDWSPEDRLSLSFQRAEARWS
ncbi:MAG: DUF58 domain-containing protein [Haloarculaceae archaeon]